MDITYKSHAIHEMATEIITLHKSSIETVNALSYQLKDADLKSSETSVLSLIEISKLIHEKNDEVAKAVSFLIKLTQWAEDLQKEETTEVHPTTTQTTRATQYSYMATLEDPYQHVDLLDEEYKGAHIL